ncbi:MAG: NAD(P)-dependent oxidoreductase [Dehalococcoidia bacterium]|nr:NAD(P)-dependent oxidoreductase [Dehalococcoidia bacterium]MDW8120524.1 NAD(P)-dependent oxidoreductase [Chloroflexota bacterium]
MATILVTGMSGLIGGIVRRRLEGKHTLYALNRRPVEGIPTHQADIADLSAILPAFAGKEVVIHLAGHLGEDWEGNLHTNIIGTYHVYEAARQHGVRRIIYASSGAVIGGWEREEPYKALVEGRYPDVPFPWRLVDHETPIRPRSLYGCGKAWGEILGRYYADAFGISVLCLRIGHVTAEDRPTRLPADWANWCSQRDIGQLIERCVEAPPTLRFAIFYGLSDNPWRYRDIEYARRWLGYAPQDSAEAYRPKGEKV